MLTMEAEETKEEASAFLFWSMKSESSTLESSLKQQNCIFSGFFFNFIDSFTTTRIPLSSGIPNSEVNSETTTDLGLVSSIDLKYSPTRLANDSLNSESSCQMSQKMRPTCLKLSVGIMMEKVRKSVVGYSACEPFLLLSSLALAYSSSFAAWRGSLMKWSFLRMLTEWSRKMMSRSALTWMSLSVVKEKSMCSADSCP